MNHLIRQQYLHVAFNGSEADGLALQARLSELCRHWLLPALEQALDRHAPPQGHLLIDQLELDLGTLPLDRLDQDLATVVAQALDQALRQPAPGNVQHQTKQQAVTDAFLYFLKTGRLPWSFRLPPGQDLEEALLESWPSTPAGLPAAWRQVLAAAPARQRLLSQFSPELLRNFLQLLSPAYYQTGILVLGKLPAPGTPPFQLTAGHVNLFEKQLWEAALQCLAQDIAATEESLVAEAWPGLSLPPPAHQAWLTLLEGHWPGATGEKDLGSSPPEVLAGTPATSATRQAQNDREAFETSSMAEGDTGEGFYVDNAGLVLLHPFLPRFFEHLGLAMGDQLLKPAAALQLLHLLATGQAAAPEYDLVLPKVLCHIALETPVERGPFLTETEKEEAQALLEAVIRHWEALKGTSPDGLRGTFLVRPGKLTLRPDGDWLLQVETRSYDILLNQLPWTISMIKLPWMQRLLRVEWNG
jgi:hypothetical protein